MPDGQARATAGASASARRAALRRSAPTRRRCASASSCSCRVRSRSTAAGASSRAASANRPIQVLENMRGLLAAAGTDFASVVKTTIYLADMADFAAVNEIYADLLRRAVPGPRHRAGGPPAARRPRRDRRHRRSSAEPASARRGPLHVEHAVDPAQRLDHLLEVLHVLDLDGHVDAGVGVGAGGRLEAQDVGVDVGDAGRRAGPACPCGPPPAWSAARCRARRRRPESHSTSMRRSGS